MINTTGCGEIGRYSKVPVKASIHKNGIILRGTKNPPNIDGSAPTTGRELTLTLTSRRLTALDPVTSDKHFTLQLLMTA